MKEVKWVCVACGARNVTDQGSPTTCIECGTFTEVKEDGKSGE